MSAASTAQLNQTIAALQGDLISIPAATALSVIESFEQQVQGLGASEIDAVIVQTDEGRCRAAKATECFAGAGSSGK